MHCPVTADDRKFMNLALDQAMRAYGQTHPNPHVGCVIVRDGKVRQRQWHAGHQARSKASKIA